MPKVPDRAPDGTVACRPLTTWSAKVSKFESRYGCANGIVVHEPLPLFSHGTAASWSMGGCEKIGVGVGVGVGIGDGVPLGVVVGVGLGALVGVGVGLALLVGVGVGFAVGLGDRVGDGVAWPVTLKVVVALAESH